MNLASLLSQQAERRPDDAALIDRHRGRTRITTYRELDEVSRRGATLLQKHGLVPGDAVLVFAPMSLELYVALLAIFRLGLVAMFLDPSAGRRHLEACCTLQAPRGLIASPKAHLLRLRSSALRRIPHKFSLGGALPATTSWNACWQLGPRPEIHPSEPESPALLTFTSGSTGTPKAALRTHRFLLAQHRVLQETLRPEEGAVDLTTLPIFVLTNLASGVTSLIPDADLRRPGKIDPAPVLDQIRRHRPTTTGASPAFLERLVAACEASGETLPAFRQLFCGGAPVFPRLLERLHLVAPNAELVAVYGSTEAEPIAEVPWSRIRHADHRDMVEGRGLLAGPPVGSIELRILANRWGTPLGALDAPSFAEACVEAGEVGEIVVSGPHVLHGYLGGHGNEQTKFEVEGTVWHRTGDSGYLDSLGRLWLLGRCSAIVEDARGTLYPFAVESAAHCQAGIARAALIAYDGQRVLAVEPGTAPPDLEELRRKLAWAQLDSIRTLKTIPVDKRHNAKIDYPALQRLLD